MSIKSTIRYAMEKYASSVKIEKAGQTTYSKAFIQPLRRRHRLYINDKIIPSGYFDNQYVLYIGDPTHPLERGMNTFITHDGQKYTVVTSEQFKVGKDIIYVWAILLEYQKMREDDYDTD